MPIPKPQEVFLTLVRWRHVRAARRIEASVEAALLRGIGVYEESWAVGTAPQTIMGWIDHQVRTMRTPYGISGFQLDLFLDDVQEPHATWEVASRSAWFLDIQPAVVDAVAMSSQERPVTIALICFGDALASTLAL